MIGPSSGTCSPPITRTSVKNDQRDQSAMRRMTRCNTFESDILMSWPEYSSNKARIYVVI